ncbi:uncharacterized protein LOC142520343 [Primulina tabacum]|uniref:uncharacterized protein LOC142520343 n=1 Tax=Primulina tabacum TaxID=48773 RepID=UPI003F5A39FF
MIQSQAGDINKYFISNKNIVAEVENTVDNSISREQDNELDENEIDTKKVLDSVDVDVFNDHEKDEEFVQYENLNQETWSDDPAKWDNIDQKVRNLLVERGLNRDVINVFPKDSANRHFNLFKKQVTKTGYGQLANEVYNDWHNLSRYLANHEAKFDPVMKEHLRRIKDHETYTTYLGCKIQNESIQMLESKVRKTILAKVRRAKYFSIILDCTPYISHKEQISIVIRCLNDSKSFTKVEEYWVQFLDVDDTSGLGLFMHLKNALVNLELDIDDIRDQGYDNGSNMKGYVIFWSNTMDLYIVLLFYQVVEDFQRSREGSQTKSEAESLVLYELENFEFLFGVVLWYKLLHAINTVSKFLQSENMDIDVAIKLLQRIVLFLEEFREDGYDKAMVEAKEMACEMGIEAVFREKRVIRRKKQFGESNSEENLENSLTHKGCSDINGDDLFSELTFLKYSLPREAKSVIDVANYFKKMDGCFPNAHIAYKILLIVPITVTSTE